MFRIILEPIDQESKLFATTIPVFDKIYEDFNTFEINPDTGTIETHLSINNDHISNLKFTEMQNILKESWDYYGLKYEFTPYPSSKVKVFIPKGYKVGVILR